MTKKHIPILRTAKFFYEDKEDIRSKIADLKKMMSEHARTLNSIMATATAYNIVRLHRALEEAEHKEACEKEVGSVKFRVRNHAVRAIEGSDDPMEALQKILNELG